MSEATNAPSTHSREEMVRGLVAQIGSYIEQYHGGSAPAFDIHTARMGGGNNQSVFP